MLIELMNHLYQDPLSIAGTREVSAKPDVTERRESTMIKRIVLEKFKADIEALERYVGQKLQSGLCINVTLTELLGILPRERKRVDAYNALKNYLSLELGVELNIKSRKRR